MKNLKSLKANNPKLVELKTAATNQMVGGGFCWGIPYCVVQQCFIVAGGAMECY